MTTRVAKETGYVVLTQTLDSAIVSKVTAYAVMAVPISGLAKVQSITVIN